MLDDVGPVGMHLDSHVRVAAATVLIRDLSLQRPTVVDYLKAIAPDKRVAALAHALEVGITELCRRRTAHLRSPGK